MKNKFTKMSFILAIISSSIFNTASASYCVQPTPPVEKKCYSTVTNEKPVDQWKNIVYIQKTTTQSEVQCPFDVDQSIYEIQLRVYNTCIQSNNNINTLNTSSSANNSTDNSDIQVYSPMCPLPTQPKYQASLTPVDTATYRNQTTVKKYSDGTFAIFNAFGKYEGVTNSIVFDNAKEYQSYKKQLSDALSSNNLDKVSDLTYMIKTYGDIGDSVQRSINSRFSNINNCPPISNYFSFITTSLPDAIVGQPYTGTILFNNPKGNILDFSYNYPVSFGTVKNPKLPSNYNLVKIEFTPQTVGQFSFNVDAIDIGGNRNILDTQKISLTVKGTTDVESSPIESTNSSTTTNLFTRTLKIGMSGDDVKQLQTLLQKLGYIPPTQKVSNYFGSVTKNAVIKFQRDNKILPSNGIFGTNTANKLSAMNI